MNLLGRYYKFLMLNAQVQNRLDCIIVQIKDAEVITEELKAKDQMA